MSAALALAIFLVAFYFIATEKANKDKVVLVASALMAVLRLVPGAEVFFSEHAGIDWNVIFLLFGMMAITAIASPFLDNVTTIMLVAPVTIVVCNRLRIPAQPYLIAEVLASNIRDVFFLVCDGLKGSRRSWRTCGHTPSCKPA